MGLQGPGTKQGVTERKKKKKFIVNLQMRSLDTLKVTGDGY